MQYSQHHTNYSSCPNGAALLTLPECLVNPMDYSGLHANFAIVVDPFICLGILDE